MKTKYIVALMKGDSEKIMGIFESLAEADEFGGACRMPHEMGLQYCFSSPVYRGKPVGDSISIHSYYNA